jgi:5-methylcytosine-specific restriction endonuclease McrA
MIPHVIRLMTYDKLPKRDIMFNRKNIYARDRNTCQYCGRGFAFEDLTFDHVVPKSKGGNNSFENVVTCCIKCNNIKGDSSPEEVGLRLIKKPTKPRWRSYVKLPFSRLKPLKMKIWQVFLQKPYWNLDR